MVSTQIFFLAFVFGAAVALTIALWGYIAPRPVQARLRQATGEAPAGAHGEVPAWRAQLIEAISPAGKLSLPSEGWENSPVRRRFLHAGYRGDQAPTVFFAVKTILTFALPLGFMLGTGVSGVSLTLNKALLMILGLAALGYYLPNLHLNRRAARRQLEVFEAFPDAIDLMTVTVEAGLSLDAAISRVADEIGVKSDILAEEFRLVGLELRAGASRATALRNLALRTGVEEVQLFVAMLVQADRFGTGMAEALRVHSEALRTKRRLRAEEAAAKIPLKQLFPLIFCIFPSIMIVLMAPAVISIYRVFIKY